MSPKILEIGTEYQIAALLNAREQQFKVLHRIQDIKVKVLDRLKDLDETDDDDCTDYVSTGLDLQKLPIEARIQEIESALYEIGGGSFTPTEDVAFEMSGLTRPPRDLMARLAGGYEI